MGKEEGHGGRRERGGEGGGVPFPGCLCHLLLCGRLCERRTQLFEAFAYGRSGLVGEAALSDCLRDDLVEGTTQERAPLLLGAGLLAARVLIKKIDGQSQSLAVGSPSAVQLLAQPLHLLLRLSMRPAVALRQRPAAPVQLPTHGEPIQEGHRAPLTLPRPVVAPFCLHAAHVVIAPEHVAHPLVAGCGILMPPSIRIHQHLVRRERVHPVFAAAAPHDARQALAPGVQIPVRARPRDAVGHASLLASLLLPWGPSILAWEGPWRGSGVR
mmetsp:Transcript_30250/g.87894  ORF Transcript_30250/g.87894 Transcript_30250/m.87894 type:complete len:270 (+) Transcript_30250:854-1663(+)